ncbi:dTDP-4-amino-4,6-dideoxygalactose transaminase [Defluviimonas sp. WL0002]|uniref:dTDP-4-amino-4,6-dideoxygalactose transaminase n=1 Tax=Albidovulum marisflavi TaxID=2984159 RepID=A0ABT2ZD51_9RHOB|nr:dTDP-4-amino-4,6-dideoxygalactose transaminase [Defluviimonas sp. WL0002]MCV2869042.1 dTDP-4-amino-4,6-dideoxygalactose transaminase [Defluviimonas sp. WL0002]
MPETTGGSSPIPFSRTYIYGNEIDFIQKTIETGRLSGPGPQSEACERQIRETVSAPWAAVVPSCTAALEMAALLIGLAPGDEVIMPSFTFVSTATSVVLRGAIPVFADIDPVTLNLCPDAAAAAITPRTKAIFVVHYAGVVADMDRLGKLATEHGLAIVEDAAQAYGAKRGGRPAGSYGAAAGFSFHGTKNIGAGEGGALVVNDPALVERAAILRDKGTDRGKFLRGEVDAYSWQDVGSSQIVSELTAAFLHAQLLQADAIRSERLALWQGYQDALREAEGAGHFTLPHPPADAEHNGHIFFLMLPDASARRDLSAHLARNGITASPHYVPLHTAPAGRRFGRTSGSLTMTDRAGECLLRLPLWNGLGDDLHRVTGAVLSWCADRRAAA